MKKLYAIYFFLDSLALIVLTFLFFNMLDKANNTLEVVLICLGGVICINILVILITKIFKLPSNTSNE